MTRVAIIPARGGSKRLPRKNILPILGKPALFYPIQAALKTGLFDRVIVSTEDDEIKQAAAESGAEVMTRPEQLAGDQAGVVQVCQDVLEQLDRQGICPAHFCCIYATAVFITPGDLHGAFSMIEQFAEADMVMGVSRFNLQPLQAMASNENGYLKPRWPAYNRLQSQHHPGLVASNGTFYWADTQAFLTEKTFYADRLKGYEIPWIRAIDLDTSEDYETAKLLAPLMLNKERS
jgi:pseudaminic acid cytidylyltransferase